MLTVGGLLGAVLVPQLVGARLPVWINAMSQVLLFLSLGLLVHTSGQVSLCQMSLAAVGAAAFAHAISGGIPWGAAVLFGGLVGLIAGTVGGWVDSLLMRITDAFLSLPAPVLAIAVVAALGPSFAHTLIAVSIVWWPFYARLVRGEVARLAARPHFEAAIAWYRKALAWISYRLRRFL